MLIFGAICIRQIERALGGLEVGGMHADAARDGACIIVLVSIYLINPICCPHSITSSLDMHARALFVLIDPICVH